MSALRLVELLKSRGIYSRFDSYKPLKDFNGFESKKARELGHTDAIRVIIGNHSSDFLVLEDGTLCTGSTFMSSDAITEIIYEFTEFDTNPCLDIFWENGVHTFEDPNDQENGAIFTTINKLREWFKKWSFVESDVNYECLPF